MPTLSAEEAAKLSADLMRARKSVDEGRYAHAEGEYVTILRRLPGHPAALQGLALLKRAQGRHEEAVELLRQAVSQAPRAVEIRCNLAAVMGMMGRHAEAAGEIRGALALRPDYVQGWLNLGVALEKSGRIEEAIEAYTHAADLAPTNSTAWASLGSIYRQAKRWTEAASAYRRYFAVGGASAEVHYGLGVALEAMKKVDEASVEYKAATGLRPDYTRARLALSRSHSKRGHFAAAAETLREGIARQPEDAHAYHAQLAHALGELGDLDGVLTSLRAQLGVIPEDSHARSALLYTLHYHQDSTPEALYREHTEWGRRHIDQSKVSSFHHDNDRGPSRRLKVGYVSPDFREHTVPRFITPVIREHDRERFEVYCYSNSNKEDATKARLRSWADHWREIRSLTDEQAERLIREDGIDILVDLRGHAADNRLLLFARKPAPIQVVMVGYFDTTGLATIDYRITDEHQDPPGETERYHVEELVRIPPTCWCYAPDGEGPPVAPPPVSESGHITFGCLNKVIKVSPACARLWSQVLDAVPNSRLLLVAPGRDTIPSVRERLECYGLPAHRTILLDKAPQRRGYLNRYAKIDIVLDTYPFCGITTTCDGLWMGVPHVSLAGQTPVSRAGKSILSSVGLPHFATNTDEQFLQAAVGLASDVDKLQSLRSTMRDRMQNSALMGHTAYTRHLEAAYTQMWSRWVAQH